MASTPDEQLPARVAARIEAVSREKTGAIVRIRCTDEHGEINGTGFYIDPTGTVCTLAEIVSGTGGITVFRDGTEIPATLAAVDRRSGVAFLKTTGAADGTSFIPPKALTNATAMTPVIGIGFPRDKRATPVLGMITGIETHDGDRFFCVPHLTASIPLSEGEGGAPVMDLSGKLLGMVITGNTQLASCKIIPASAIGKLHQDLIRYGRLEPGWIGAVVEEAAVPQGNSRTRIVSLEQGSPAEAAGLRPGDILLSLGGRSVCQPEDVLGASFYLTAGDKVRVSLIRGGNLYSVDLHCIEVPGMENTNASLQQASLFSAPSSLP